MPRGANAYGHAALQKRLWTPDLLGSSLVAWYSADSGVTVISDKVSNWVDKSGRGYTAVQSDPTKRCSYLNRESTLLSSNGPILFNSSSEAASLFIIPLNTYLKNYNGRFAASVLCRHNADTTESDTRILSCIGSPNTRFGIWTKFTTLGFRVGGRRLDADSLVLIAHSSIETAKWYIVTGIADYTNGYFYIRVNGSQSSVAMPSGGGSTSNTTGGTTEIIKWGNMSIAEIVIYENFYQDFIIEGYLAWRHGIAFSNEHPFVSRPPLIGD